MVETLYRKIGAGGAQEEALDITGVLDWLRRAFDEKCSELEATEEFMAKFDGVDEDKLNALIVLAG